MRLSDNPATMQRLLGVSMTQEKWVINVDNGSFLFSREVNGCIKETYAPVNREKATVFAVAIIQGFEPPRLLTPMSSTNRDSQSLQGHLNSGIPVD